MDKIYLRDIDDSQMEVDFVRFFHFKNTNYLIYTKNEIDEKGYIKLYPVKVMESLGEKIARSIKDETEWSNMQSIVKTVIKEIRDEKIESFIDLDKNEIENLKIIDSRYFKLDPKLVEILCSNSVLGIDNKIELTDINENINSSLPIFESDELFSNNSDIDLSLQNSQILTEDMIDDNEETKATIDLNNGENVSIWQDKNINKGIEENIQEEVEKEDNDYKALYETTLKEKEELSDILTNMIIELTNYKIKYGELKEN